MREKEISVFLVRVMPTIIVFAIGCVSLNLMGCGSDETETDDGTNQLTAEEQKDLARFVEYVLFPSSPYVDKSWVETDVPEEEVAKNFIDFETETAAIQQVYTAVYNAWEASDFDTVASHFYPPSGIRFVFLCGGAGILVLSTYEMRNPWNQCGGAQAKEGPNPLGPLSASPLLIEFYIRRANVQYPWPEASAKTADNVLIYLTKRGDRWFMNELVRSKHSARKYFDDPKYKAPE